MNAHNRPREISALIAVKDSLTAYFTVVTAAPTWVRPLSAM